MDTSPTPLTAGKRVADRFRIDRNLGAGAMGAVYAATDEETGRECAIKVIHPHVAKAGVNAERFRREVTLAQQVGHPGIVRVFDAGKDPQAGLFMVMELLRGVTFRAPLMQGDLTCRQGLEVIVATLDALQAAHRIGIVHRDLKPDNIFLHAPDDAEPSVKLLDFGVARQRNAAGITTTNVGLGTPHFMAPEQATDARSVTAASDVWSAGVMLYYVFCGALPFDGDGPYDTVLRACTVNHVPLDRRAPDVDYRLVDIIETCLEKDPLERFQDAGELLEVLAPLLSDTSLVTALSAHTAAEPREDWGWANSASSWDVSEPAARSDAIGFALTAEAAPRERTVERPPPLPTPPLPQAQRSGWRIALVAMLVLAVVGMAAFRWLGEEKVLAVESLSPSARDVDDSTIDSAPPLPVVANDRQQGAPGDSPSLRKTTADRSAEAPGPGGGTSAQRNGRGRVVEVARGRRGSTTGAGEDPRGRTRVATSAERPGPRRAPSEAARPSVGMAAGRSPSASSRPRERAASAESLPSRAAEVSSGGVGERTLARTTNTSSSGASSRRSEAAPANRRRPPGPARVSADEPGAASNAVSAGRSVLHEKTKPRTPTERRGGSKTPEPEDRAEREVEPDFVTF